MVEIPVMVTKAVINIQEDKMVDVAVAIEWVLDITAVQSMDTVAVAANLQEVRYGSSSSSNWGTGSGNWGTGSNEGRDSNRGYSEDQYLGRGQNRFKKL